MLPVRFLHAISLMGLFAAIVAPVHAQVGANWRQRSPLPGSEQMQSVVVAGSHLVAVGQGRALMRSDDNGATWTAGHLVEGQLYNPTSVAYNGSLLLAEAGNAIFSSTDEGASWSQVGTDLTFNDFTSNILWTGTKWVVLSQLYNNFGNYSELKLKGSTDGLHWTTMASVPGPSPTISITINKLLWNGTHFMLVGNRYDQDTFENQGIMMRTDAAGTTWDTTVLTDGTDYLYDVAWSGTQFVAVGSTGSNGPYTSPTGVVWTSHAGGPTGTKVVWTGTQFVSPGFNSVSTSPDGITWTQEASPPAGFDPQAAIWTGSQMVAVGFAGGAYTSPTGVTWTRRSPAGPLNSFGSVAANGAGLLVAGDATSGNAFVSTDNGDTWTDTTAVGVISGVVWTGTKFVAVNGSNSSTSTDGSAWTTNTSFQLDSMKAVAHSGGMLVAVGSDTSNNAAIYTSTDGGGSWTARTVPSNAGALGAVARAGTVWVAVGESSTLLTSPDGVTWTKRATGSAGFTKLQAVAASPSITVALGAFGGAEFFTSTNGTTWTKRAFPTYASISSVVWTGTVFVAVGTTGDAFTSADGITWTARYTNTANELDAVCWDGTQVVAVGASGTVLSSDVIPTARFAVAAQNAGEGDGAVPVQVLLSLPATSTITIPITVGGSATNGTDYTAPPANVVFNAGEQSKAIYVVLTDDGAVESSETVQITLGTTTGVRIGAVNQHTLTINDNDGQPPASFTSAAVTAQEHSGTVGVSIELGWPAPSTVTVPITVGGTAGGGDFSGVPASVVFNTGEVSKFISLVVQDDADQETDETVTLTLGAPTGGTLGATTVFTLTIKDNDPDTELGRRWTLRTPLPAADSMSAITSMPSRQVVVGAGGLALTSDDAGLSWSRRFTSAGPETSASDVIWTGTTLVAPCYNGHVLTSPNGIVWADRTLPGVSSNTSVNGAASNGTRSVVVGSDFVNGIVPVIWSTLDQVHWTQESLPATDGGLQSVTYTGAQFVAVGYQDVYDYNTNTSTITSIVLTSPDGRAWTQRTSAVINNVALYSVLWAGNKLVAFDSSKSCYTSPDGSTWTKRTLGTLGTISTGVWNGTKVLGAGMATATSSDGITWVQKASPAKTPLMDATWTGSSFIAVSDAGIYTSPDGAAWTKRSIGVDSYDTLYSVAWSGTQFVAVGGDYERVNASLIFTSPDGITWAQRTTTNKTPLFGVAWSGTTFVAVGANGTILTSPNGIAWSPHASGTNLDLHDVIWAANQFVAVGGHETDEDSTTGPGGSVVLTSPNGITWTRRTIPTSQPLEGVVFNGSLFVAVGRSTFDTSVHPAVILTSPNAINWTARSSGLNSHDLQHVTWGNSMFVATHDGFGFLTSPDGIAWAPATSVPPPPPSPYDVDLHGITYDPNQGRFYAVGQYGVTLFSDDGDSWKLVPSELTGGRLFGITTSSGRLVAVGANASIQTSGAGGTPQIYINFDQASTNVFENAGVANMLVTLSSPASTKVTVNYTLTPGPGAPLTTTGPNADVTVSAGPLVFNPGETAKYISVIVKDDKVDEAPTEQLTIALSSVTGPAIVGTSAPSSVLAIFDDDTAPVIVTPPQHRLVPVNDPLTLTVLAGGSQPLAYQWKKNNVAVPGATGATYYVPKAALTHAGTYTCVVSNGAGSIPTNAVEVGVFEKIVKNIANAAGKDAVMTETVAGNGLTLAWYKDNSLTEFAASPPHITYDATKKTLTLKALIAGDAGSYQCTVLQAASSLLWNASRYEVDVVPVKPTLDAITLPGGQVGVPYSFTVQPGAGSSEIASWGATGLPAGLSIDSVTGEILGNPTATATNKAVTITATNGIGSTSKTTTITVLAIHSGLIGTCNGLMDRHATINNNLGARVSLTVSSNGQFTGSYTIGATAQSFNGQAIATSPTAANGTTTLYVGGKLVTIAFNYDATLVSGPTTSGTVNVVIPGVVGSVSTSFKSWRAHATPASFAGRHHFALHLDTPQEGLPNIPQGVGFGSATITAAGAITWAGKLGDGVSVISGTGTVGTDGTCPFYLSTYGGNGSFIAQPVITVGGAGPAFADTTILDTTNASWCKRPDTTTAGARNYPAGWSPIAIKLEGAKYIAPSTGHSLMDQNYIPGSSNARLTFEEAAVDYSSPPPDVFINIKPAGTIDTLATYLNLRSVSFTGTNSTGGFKGTMNMTDKLPNGVSIPRTGVVYEGQVVRIIGNTPETQGYGYFSLPQMPDFNISPTPPASSTPILSGSVELIPYP